MKRSLACSFAIAITIMMLTMGQPLYAQNPRPPQVPNRQALAAPTPPAACCPITAIDTSTGVVTAKENAAGKIFQFKVTDAALLKSLKVGQGVYANFGAMQVSLDGSTVCCSIISIGSPPPASAPVAKPAPRAPAAAAPPATSTPPASRAATPSQTIAQIKPLPTMSYGTPHPITLQDFPPIGPGVARSQQRMIGGAIVAHVRGVDGLEQVQGLPEGVKNLLAIHVRTLPAGESDHYIINVAQAQQWITTHPIPSDVKPTDVKTGDGHSGCNSFSWHCAEESAKHAEDEATRQANNLRDQAQADWKHFGGPLTQAWHEAESCLADRSEE